MDFNSSRVTGPLKFDPKLRAAVPEFRAGDYDGGGGRDGAPYPSPSLFLSARTQEIMVSLVRIMVAPRP